MLLESQRIDRNETVVVFDTGAGFKSDPPADQHHPRPVPNDPGEWDAVISNLRSAPLV
jgi:hypothetical protein